MDEPRRNDAFDRELRRALAASGGGTPGPHVDAELAAAWMDRRLDPAAAHSVEAHLAGCHDCQALFATLARIAPGEATANEGLAWWRRLRAGWLVPATVAAAAALVIWVAVPQQRAASTAPESLATQDERQAPQPPATPQEPAPATPEAKTAAPPALALETDTAADRRFAEPVPDPQRKTAALERAAPTPAAAAPAAPPASELERRDRLADAAAPPPAGSLKETIVVEGQTPAVDAQSTRKAMVAGAAPQPPQAPAPAAERQEAASAAQGQLLRQNAQLAAGLRAPAGLTIIAIDGAARWRRAGPRIEFAPRADAGFTAVTLPAPADAIAAGSSPGGTVCWLAGRDGLVLVTTDGVRFARVSAPASTSFVGVMATDARTATVTAADGRRFRTTDGGATWASQ